MLCSTHCDISKETGEKVGQKAGEEVGKEMTEGKKTTLVFIHPSRVPLGVTFCYEQKLGLLESTVTERGSVQFIGHCEPYAKESNLPRTSRSYGDIFLPLTKVRLNYPSWVEWKAIGYYK